MPASGVKQTTPPFVGLSVLSMIAIRQDRPAPDADP
jgi:hypothetical protein